MTSRVLLVAGVVPLLASCASPRGTAPHDMSAAGHEAAAARDERAADQERSRYDPDAWHGRDCRGFRLGELQGACWSEPSNSTEGHLEESRRLHAQAERHRLASAELRDAEERSCAGVAIPDRDESPFAHREDVLRVEPFASPGRRGVEALFRRVPGLTAEGLRKIAVCHAARNAVLGHDRAESAWCPLAVPGVEVESAERADGIVLRVTSSEEGTGAEILRRARATCARGSRDGGP